MSEKSLISKKKISTVETNVSTVKVNAGGSGVSQLVRSIPIHLWIIALSIVELGFIGTQIDVRLEKLLPIEAQEEITEIFGSLSLRRILKPCVALTMCLYMGVIQTYVDPSKKAFCRFMAVANFFAALGDVLIHHDFVQGLLSFAVCHIALIISFLEHSEFSTERIMNIAMPFTVLMFAVCSTLFQYIIRQDQFPSQMKVPVGVYIGLITIMIIVQTLRSQQKTPTKAIIISFIGSVFFIVSDTLIAINKFVPAFSETDLSLPVLSTYYIALELIFIGSLFHIHQAKVKPKTNTKEKDD